MSKSGKVVVFTPEKSGAKEQPLTNTAKHAIRELQVLLDMAEGKEDRPIIEPFITEVVAICQKFGNSGQSGGSAPFTADVIASVIKKLLMKQPICPITGEAREWVDISEHNGGQPWFGNIRFGAVFKDGEDKTPYFVDALKFKDPQGLVFTGYALSHRNKKVHSRQYINLPFTPKSFYIDVVPFIFEGEKSWRVKTPEQLTKALAYYNSEPIK